MLAEPLLITGHDQELEELFSTEEGKKIHKCIECGMCTGICVVQDVYPEYNIRRILTKVALGLKDEVLNSEEIWLCAHCYSCVVKCPKGVRPADRMSELRGMALRKNIDNKGVKHAKAFIESVLKNGKINEAKVTLNSVGFRGLMSQGLFPLSLILKGKAPKYRKKPIKSMDKLKPIIESILEETT